jgi:multidrug efflux pump
LRDVARIELGAAEYALRSVLNNKSAVAIPIFQAPGSNAITISDNVRATMAELKQNMPEGMDYSIVYDPTQFVRASIEAVVHTLLQAIALVVLVVILFLQTWRASIIPLLAVPISTIGTFAVMYLLGFSINALSLFGLVLAIGIVMGVVPLVISAGAGAEMRHAMCIAVFAGMIGVTLFGIFLTPVFYVLLRQVASNRPLRSHGAETTHGSLIHDQQR